MGKLRARFSLFRIAHTQQLSDIFLYNSSCFFIQVFFFILQQFKNYQYGQLQLFLFTFFTMHYDHQRFKNMQYGHQHLRLKISFFLSSFHIHFDKFDYVYLS